MDALPSRRTAGGLRLDVGRLSVARRLIRLLARSPFRETAEPGVTPLQEPGRSTRVVIMIPQALEASIRASAPRDPEGGWGWVRGFLAGCGALYLPRNGYYLLFQVRGGPAAADRLAEILTRGGYSFGRRPRGAGIDVTLRKGQEIRRLLERIGLGEVARRIDETASVRSMRDRANRLVNCDSANIDKTVLAAERQMVLARLLEENGALWDLPDPLEDVVRTRLANPSASLRELGHLLSRPVSKSTVEYRWRKIETLVQTMMKGEGHHVPGKG